MRTEERNAYFDNLKFILIFLVVLGHFSFEFRTEPFMKAIGNATYTFIMPVFIYISGFFSRRIKSPRVEDFYKLIIPYFLLEILNLIYTKTSGLGYGNISFQVPTYQNWYLLALFYWRITTPILSKFDKKIIIPLSFLLAFVAGFATFLDDTLALYRSIYYFPIFALGYYGQDISVKIQSLKKYRLLAMGLLIAFMLFVFYCTYTNKNLGDRLLYAYTPMLGYKGDMQNILWRSVATLSAIACGFLFMFFIPFKKMKISELGRNSFYVYLFHMFIVFPIIDYITPYQGIQTYFISMIAALMITFALSTEISRKLLQPIIEPINLFSLFRKRE